MNSIKYSSPWIEHLKKRRKITQLSSNIETETVIVGAGIAGITTAYYLLKDTNKKVIVLEANKLAHGATGHNAGQIASYFEHSFSSIAKKYGLKEAAKAQRFVLSAWDLLDHIIFEVDLKHKPLSFAGFAGCTTIEQLLSHLENSYKRHKQNVVMDFAYVKNDPKILSKIPNKYSHLYLVEDSSRIQKKLETNSKEFIAALSVRKGCMNSAKFCEEVVEYLYETYPQRFMLYEENPVSEIILSKPLSTVKMKKNNSIVKAKDIILCSNGFRGFTIKDSREKEIKETPFKSVEGLVGYMAGYEYESNKRPTAISYFPKDFDKTDAYYYLTRRPINSKKRLVCIGGPDFKLSDSHRYDNKKHYLENSEQDVKNFLKKYHCETPSSFEFKYKWEGLMGYTKTKIRVIGRDKKYPQLWYNLGCNGVGILPSIFGSKRISLLFQGKKLDPTIFDPGYK